MVTRWRLVAALVLAFASAAIGWLSVLRGHENATPAPKPVQEKATFTPEARRVAREFLTAVGRMDRARARRLMTATAPCSRMVVSAGLFEPTEADLSVAWAQPTHLFLDVVIRRKGRAAAVLMMGLQRRGKYSWRVDYWDMRWGPRSPWCEMLRRPTGARRGPARGRRQG